MELIIYYTLKKACFRAVNKHMRSSKDNYPNGKEKNNNNFPRTSTGKNIRFYSNFIAISLYILLPTHFCGHE